MFQFRRLRRELGGNLSFTMSLHVKMVIFAINHIEINEIIYQRKSIHIYEYNVIK